MNKSRAPHLIGKWALNILVTLFSITCVFPLIWMLYSSLKTQKEFSLNIISLPAKPQFHNYSDAYRIGKMQTYFWNSAYVSIISVALIIVIGFVVAYFLSRYKFPGATAIYLLFLSGMLIPIHGLLIPVFVEFKVLHLLNQHYTLILPYVAFGLPMVIFLMESFIRSIPMEMEEAAVVDGSTTVRTMFTIILPMCLPVLSTGLILSFLSSWNEFPFALVLLSRDSLKTLPVGLTNFNGQFSVNYTQMMAGMMIVVLPVLVTYLAFSKRIIQGMTAGAVKG